MIQNMLDLSTSHVPSDSPDFGPYRFASHDYGWVLFVPLGDNYLNCPKWLHKIMLYADANSCVIVNFDRDAEVSDKFKTYEW